MPCYVNINTDVVIVDDDDDNNNNLAHDLAKEAPETSP